MTHRTRLSRLIVPLMLAVALAACNTTAPQDIDYSRIGFASDDGSR